MNKKKGFVDKKGNLIIPIQYKSAYNFNEGLARVSYDGKNYGMIDKNGNVVIPDRKYSRIELYN